MIAAVNLGKINADVKEREIRLQRWQTQLHPVRGVHAWQLFAEAARHSEDWDYVRWDSKLRDRPMLIVAADDQNRAELNALAAALQRKGSTSVRYGTFQTDHSFSDQRIGLQAIFLDWLQTL